MEVPSFNLTLSGSAPILNVDPAYWSSGLIVSEQISNMGFSMPGHGPGMFLEITATDVDAWEVISIDVPRI